MTPHPDLLDQEWTVAEALDLSIGPDTRASLIALSGIDLRTTQLVDVWTWLPPAARHELNEAMQ